MTNTNTMHVHLIDDKHKPNACSLYWWQTQTQCMFTLLMANTNPNKSICKHVIAVVKCTYISHEKLSSCTLQACICIFTTSYVRMCWASGKGVRVYWGSSEGVLGQWWGCISSFPNDSSFNYLPLVWASAIEAADRELASWHWWAVEGSASSCAQGRMLVWCVVWLWLYHHSY